jgi:Tannase and feruloyl esterase
MKVLYALFLASSVWAQQPNACANLANFKASNVEITKSSAIAAGTTELNSWCPGHSAPLPAYCRVEGVINRRTCLGGEEFGISFVLAMPDKWNGDFLMQGGAGSNGIVMPPLGLNATGDTPALMRGFAVVSTDTGHKSHHLGFDFAFEKDQQAYLDFAYLANAEVATLAKATHRAPPWQAASIFVLLRMFHRWSRRYGSFAALSDPVRWHHLGQSGNADWTLQFGDWEMDSGRLQPNRAERFRGETSHYAGDHR